MEDRTFALLKKRMTAEPFAQKMGIRLIELKPGYAKVEMAPRGDHINIFGMIHGGAIFSLIDEAFQLSCNSHGRMAVALNVSVTYHRAPDISSTLTAESRELSCSPKTASYEIKVTDEKENLIASSMALAYRKKEDLTDIDIPRFPGEDI